MRIHIVVVPALAALFLLSACTGLSEVTTGAPPQLDPAKVDAAEHPLMDEINTVAKNVAFANTLMDLYGQRSERLRDASYVSTLPLYAAGVATGALLLNNVGKTAIINIGLGAGAYYGAVNSLDFSGRADVLDGAIASWQCFADVAGHMSFLDPKTPPTGMEKPVLGAVIVHDYQLLERTSRKARAYLADGQITDKENRALLAAAVDAANAVLPAAGAIAQSASQADLIFGKYRRIILRHVSTAYAGRRIPFSYKATLGGVSNGIEQLVDFRARAQLAHDKMPNVSLDPEEAEKVICDCKAKDNRAETFSQFIDKVDPGKDAHKVRALVYILMETIERFSNHSRYLAVASLPVDLAKCVP